jgi:hypothetical protein
MQRPFENQLTRYGERLLVLYGRFFGGWLAVSDDPRPRTRESSWYVNDGDAAAEVSLTPSFDNNTLIATFSAALGTSLSARTIRRIGLAQAQQVTLTRYGYAFTTMAVLDPPIALAPSEVLTATYHVRHTIGPKGMFRWDTFSREVRQRMAQADAHGASPFNAYNPTTLISPHVSYGSYFFADGGAAYLMSPSGVPSWTTHAVGFGDTTAVDMQSLLRNWVATTIAASSGKVGAFMSLARGVSGPAWTVGNSTGNPTLGGSPLVLPGDRGRVSRVFAHPTGQTNLYAGAGGATSLGAVQVMGPYRSEHPELPRSRGYRVRIVDAGDTDPGTEGTYVVERGLAALNDVLTGNAYLYGQDGAILHRVVSGLPWTGKSPDSTVYDGRGTYWSVVADPGVRAYLSSWKGGTDEEVHVDVESDTTRWYGLDHSDSLVVLPSPLAAFNGGQAAPGLATDGAGLVFFPVRKVAAGQQALYVLDHTKPGRQYQRPSGVALGGTNTFKVVAGDEVHAMSPFVNGDVGKRIRIVTGPNAGIRTITARTNDNTVTLDGSALVTDLDVTWHWVLVTKRDQTNGLANNIRTLLYDQANSRLWAFTDSGLQVSTDAGATWSATIDQTNGLSTPQAVQAIPASGYETTGTVVVDKAGAIYWFDVNGGINKYVGSGPGGTHSRITSASLPQYTSGYATMMVYDAVAPHMATDEGALWLGAYTSNRIWRLDLNLPFVAGSVVAYRGNGIDYDGIGAAHCGIAGADGVVYFNTTSNGWIHWDPAAGAFDYTFPDRALTTPPGGVAATTIKGPGELIYSPASASGAWARLWGLVTYYRWDDVALQWRPWAGTGAQFDARHGTTNNGKRKCHASWQSIPADGLRVRFVQSGAITPTDEYVADETFTMVGAWGVVRDDDTVDATWRGDIVYGSPMTVREDSRIRVAQLNGAKAYWAASTTTPIATLKTTALGSGDLPELTAGGRSYGATPRRYPGMTSGNGPCPETHQGSNSKGITVGLDLGSAQIVAALCVQFAQHSYEPRRIDATTFPQRWRVFHSDDNAAWTEVTAARLLSGTSGSTDADPAYQHVDVEMYAGKPANPAAATRPPGHLVTFQLRRSGMSTSACTHRYWKVTFASIDVEDNNLSNNTDSPSTFTAIWARGPDGTALGIPGDMRLDEHVDARWMATAINHAVWIQDRVGGGKGGISSGPDSFADGWTDTITLDSGSFNTGAISTATDRLAWRHPTTAGFYLPGADKLLGSPVAAGSTEVRIVSRTSNTIVVDGRVIPDNLSGVDWEVRRPVVVTPLHPASGELSVDSATGYLQCHDDDVGREFRIVHRTAVRR